MANRRAAGHLSTSPVAAERARGQANKRVLHIQIQDLRHVTSVVLPRQHAMMTCVALLGCSVHVIISQAQSVKGGSLINFF